MQTFHFLHPLQVMEIERLLSSIYVTSNEYAYTQESLPDYAKKDLKEIHRNVELLRRYFLNTRGSEWPIYTQTEDEEYEQMNKNNKQ